MSSDYAFLPSLSVYSIAVQPILGRDFYQKLNLLRRFQRFTFCAASISLNVACIGSGQAKTLFQVKPRPPLSLIPPARTLSRFF